MSRINTSFESHVQRVSPPSDLTNGIIRALDFSQYAQFLSLAPARSYAFGFAPMALHAETSVRFGHWLCLANDLGHWAA